MNKKGAAQLPDYKTVRRKARIKALREENRKLEERLDGSNIPEAKKRRVEIIKNEKLITELEEDMK